MTNAIEQGAIALREGNRKESQRTWLCLDWLARKQLPIWLDVADLPIAAAAVRGLAAISSPEAARQSLPVLESARVAAAARGGEWDTARGHAWHTARVAARAGRGLVRRVNPEDAAANAAAIVVEEEALHAALDASNASLLTLRASAREFLDEFYCDPRARSPQDQANSVTSAA